VPLGIHPSLERCGRCRGATTWSYLRGQFFFNNVVASDSIRHAFTSFYQYGTFDKFPKFKLVLLEAGASWIAYWLDRLDAVFNSGLGRTIPLKEKPSFYFDRQVWISADPDERALPAMVDLVGADKFFWASDFPHPDHAGNLHRGSRGDGGEARTRSAQKSPRRQCDESLRRRPNPSPFP